MYAFIFIFILFKVEYSLKFLINSHRTINGGKVKTLMLY